MVGLLVLGFEMFRVSGASAQSIDQLHDIFNAASAKQGSAVRMVLSGCPKDKSGLYFTCYFTVDKDIRVEALADNEKGPVKRVTVVSPEGRLNGDRMISIADGLAAALAPQLSKVERAKLVQTLAAKGTDVFDDGEKTIDLASHEFRYAVKRQSIRLDVKSLAGTCVLGKTC
jgi:hypothetical protein